MSLIVNIRGTNGSGKTTLVRSILGTKYWQQPNHNYMDEKGRLKSTIRTVAQRDEYGGMICAIGKYDVGCGGCDTIKTQDLICQSVTHAAQMFTVVMFEGVLVSTLSSRYIDLSKQLQQMGHQFVWAYLDTPLHVCLDRIYMRNGGKQIKTDLVANKIAAIDSTRTKALKANEHVIDLAYEYAVPQLDSLIKGINGNVSRPSAA